MKAIDTEYKGNLFRSRLEARHAILFDCEGIEWTYEQEGYELDGIRYLPDFYIPQSELFIEIMGIQPNQQEQEKAWLLSCESGRPVIITVGMPVSEWEQREKGFCYIDGVEHQGFLGICGWHLSF